MKVTGEPLARAWFAQHLEESFGPASALTEHVSAHLDLVEQKPSTRVDVEGRACGPARGQVRCTIAVSFDDHGQVLVAREAECAEGAIRQASQAAMIALRRELARRDA